MASTSSFLPSWPADLAAKGWDQLDILIISGDAYVDHPAFGPALVARWLEHHGYRVGMIAQPRWDSIEDISRLGRPRLFVGVSAGNLDSMLNKLTAQKKVRSTDDYSPGGQPGLRPNRATVVYSNLCRQAFPGLPIILGGIEASLRRLAHYDYWSDSVRRSVLFDAKAHLLVFGMAERAIVQIAHRLNRGETVDQLTEIPGTAHPLGSPRQWKHLAEASSQRPGDGKPLLLPSFEEVRADKKAFARMARLAHAESSPYHARCLLQPHGDEAVWLNPPALPLKTEELDRLYRLPFCRAQHPSYEKPVPALATVRHSLAVVRGCFGGCAFCSIAEHEGRIVQSRSPDSILEEVRLLVKGKGFDGTLTDVGGPTANMYGLRCKNEALQRVCRRSSCLHPRVCRHLGTDAGPYLHVLRALRKVPGVRHVLVQSGIRLDLAERSPAFVQELAQFHTGGQLSVAPEHCQSHVLQAMRKPSIECYERFARIFDNASQRAGKKQYLIPYWVVGHPGDTLADVVELALYLQRHGLRPRQVQEFIPTPMSVATAMYYTGIDPSTGKPVAVERDLRRKRAMKSLLLYWDSKHWPMAREALVLAGRSELIGVLVPKGPRKRR